MARFKESKIARLDTKALEKITVESASRKAKRLRADNDKYTAVIANHLKVFIDGDELKAPVYDGEYTHYHNNDIHIRKYLEALPHDLSQFDVIRVVAILYAIDNHLELYNLFESLQVTKTIEEVSILKVKVRKPAGDLHRLMTAEGESFNNGVPQEYLDLFPDAAYIRRPRDSGQVVVIKPQTQ